MGSSLILRPPFTADFAQFCRDIRFNTINDAQNDATLLFKAASEKLKPKIFLRELFIDAHMQIDQLPAIRIEHERFTGKGLAALADQHRVIGYVATCGSEMDSFDLSSQDFLAPYWLDILKTQALDAALIHMHVCLAERFGITKPSSLNPGSGNVDFWPIEQLQGLFRLLGDTDVTGVTLKKNSLMIPNKSLAGIIFTPSNTEFESCAYCEREYCRNRRVPFKERW